MYAILLPLMAALMLTIWFMVTSLAAFLQESLGRVYSVLSAATTVFVGLMVTIGALGGSVWASAFLLCVAGICLWELSKQLRDIHARLFRNFQVNSKS